MSQINYVIFQVSLLVILIIILINIDRYYKNSISEQSVFLSFNKL